MVLIFPRGEGEAEATSESRPDLIDDLCSLTYTNAHLLYKAPGRGVVHEHANDLPPIDLLYDSQLGQGSQSCMVRFGHSFIPLVESPEPSFKLGT